MIQIKSLIHGVFIFQADDLCELTRLTWQDVLYTEKPFDLKTGDTYTDPETGWINSYGIVGKGYGDRYITRSGLYYWLENSL